MYYTCRSQCFEDNQYIECICGSEKVRYRNYMQFTIKIYDNVTINILEN
eukprot:UN03718